MLTGFRNIFRTKDYFIVFEVEKVPEKGKIVNQEIYDFIGKYFKQRNREVEYVEPYVYSQEYKTYMVLGTHSSQGNSRRAMATQAFLLELYAQIQNPSQYFVSKDFPLTSLKVNDKDLSIYTIPNKF